MNLKNSYFILRHGETPYQAERKNTIYPWPEQEPILLTEKGIRQIESVAQKLKNEKIDLIFSSDVPRAKQTAEIVAKELGLAINFDKRLRDINFGVYAGGPRRKFYLTFPNPVDRFHRAPRGGENLLACQKRMVAVLKEIDRKYEDKKVLIVGHCDPLWLLEGAVKGWAKKQLLWQKFTKRTIKVGELRKLA